MTTTARPWTTGRSGRPARPRTVHATIASTVTVAISACILVLSSSTHDGWLVLLAGLGLGTVISAALLRPHLDRLRPAVELPDHAQVGEELGAVLTVTNDGRRRSVPVTATVRSPLLEVATVRIPALGPGESARAELALLARRRGALDRIDVTLHTTAPFSLIAVTHVHAIPVASLVRPASGSPLVLAPGGAGEGHVLAQSAPGVEVQGIREWHRGEATGRLYARGTARHGRPLVLDRHDDLGDGLAVIVVGADDRSSATHALQESMISVVAATLVEHAAAGREVTVLARQAGHGDLTASDPSALLDWTARLGTPASPSVADISRAAAAAGRGGHVVLAQLGAVDDLDLVGHYAQVAAAAGVTLYALHRLGARRDALCLHDARHHESLRHDGAGRTGREAS